MKRTTLHIFSVLLFPAVLCAQEVTLFKQHNMKRWGIPAGNYSGITHIQGDRYALISDKQEADGWTEVSISFLPSGDIGKMQFIARHFNSQTLGKARDSEGIAYVAGQGFFIAAENDQQIVELTADGTPTGRKLSVPTCYSLSNIFSNYGFESLTYNAAQGIFWTTTEQGLKSDVNTLSTHAAPQPTLLRIQSFGNNLQPLYQYAYKTEAPATSRPPRLYAFGVPELLSVDDTTLLVMERELNIPERYNNAKCHIRLYSVNPQKQQPITEGTTPLREMGTSAFLPKTLVTAFSTGFRIIGRKNFANYEGMCLGPKQADGSQTILLVADSQNRAGNSLFHLKDYIRVLKIRRQ
ncbi:MAG: esterase-like activity of phytase family protein [Bacteroidaceae bacterium]|nr:esterase-like activity of phytase family protein [Bacteroidaceae bacterium]